jgi:Holliday junction DNA helicase RuvA
MIRWLKGRLQVKAPDQMVVDVGGVGYQLFISLNCFYRLPAPGAEVTMQVHTHVREDALQLYGFLDEGERVLFLLLIQVSGIGPRAALAVLSGMEALVLEDAIDEGDIRKLTSVPGIGKKKAELLVFQLREKVRTMRTMRATRETSTSPQRGGDGAEAVSALVNLGYKHVEAERAVAGVEDAGGGPLEDVIREALRRLAS